LKGIFIPAGRGKNNFVDVRDLGEVATLALGSNEHLNRPSELTGSTAHRLLRNCCYPEPYPGPHNPV
jgi:uncharacterized protein YbjT (DUF2867 family)